MSGRSSSDPGAVGPYRLVQRLGEGGMGVVHLGLDAEGRAVAVKVLRAHVAADPDARRRLGREVATLRRVRDPRVAEVIDADVDGAVPYLVTRFVPGRPLDAHIREHGPLARGHVARVGTVLAEALCAIHAVGVVHRDVKPANVMLLDGDPVVIDFGIAHVADEARITHTGLVMGTPGYLSPEVVAGQPVTPATDWWGWGATLAFAATGRAPFGSGPIEVVLDRVRRGECDLDGVDGHLRDALAAALTLDPARRPPPEQLVRALTGPIAQRSGRLPGGATTLGAGSTVTGSNGTGATGAGSNGTGSNGTGSNGAVSAGAAWNGLAGPAAAAAMPTPNEELTARVPPPWPQPPTGAAPPDVPVAAPPAGARTAPTAPPAAGTEALGLPPTKAFGPAPSEPPPPVPPAGRPLGPTAARPAAAPAPLPGPPPAPPTGPPPGRAPDHPVRPQGAAPASAPPSPDGAADPTVGILAAAVVVMSAVAMVVPYHGAWGVALAMVLARVVDRSSTALTLRRREHGPRGSDLMVTAVAAPWRVVVSVVMTVLALVLPVLVGISMAFIVGAAQAGPSSEPLPARPLPLAVGMAALVLTAWWGPGGGSFRRGTRVTVQTLVRGRRSRIAAWSALGLLFAAALLTVSNGGAPDLGPLDDYRLSSLLR